MPAGLRRWTVSVAQGERIATVTLRIGSISGLDRTGSDRQHLLSLRTVGCRPGKLTDHRPWQRLHADRGLFVMGPFSNSRNIRIYGEFGPWHCPASGRATPGSPLLPVEGDGGQQGSPPLLASLTPGRHQEASSWAATV